MPFETALQQLFGSLKVPSNEPLPQLFFGLICAVSLIGLTLLSVRLIPLWKESRSFLRIFRDFKAAEFVARFARIDTQLNDLKQFPHLAFQWSEFRESLHRDADANKIYNSLDAEHFFDTTKLIDGPGLREFHSALPGVLTGLGILGTFIGLVTGLPAAQESAEGTALTTQAVKLVGGLQLAFRSSVWGLTASLAYLIIEKTSFALTERPVVDTCRILNGFVERHTEESYLREIDREGKRQSAALESFSTDLAGAVKKATSEAFATELAPLLQGLINAIDELRRQKEKESADALKELIETLSVQLSGAAGEQLRAFAASLEKAREWNDRLESTLGAIVERLANAEEHQGGLVRETQAAISQIAPLLHQVQEAVQAVAGSADDIRSAGTSQQEAVLAFQNMLERADATAEGLHAILASCSLYVQQVREATDAQRGIMEGARDLQGAHNAAMATFAQITERVSAIHDAIAETLTHQRDVAGDYATLADKLQREIESVSSVAEQISEASASLHAAAVESRAALDGNAELAQKALSQTRSIQAATDGLLSQLAESTSATASLWRGFSEQLNSVATDLASQLEEFKTAERDALDEILRDFDGYLAELATRMKGSIDGLGDITSDLVQALDDLRTSLR